MTGLLPSPKSQNTSFFSRVSSFLQQIGGNKDKEREKQKQAGKKCGVKVSQGTLREVDFTTTEWDTDSTEENQEENQDQAANDI